MVTQTSSKTIKPKLAKKIVTHFDITAIIAAKGLIDMRPLATLTN